MNEGYELRMKPPPPPLLLLLLLLLCASLLPSAMEQGSMKLAGSGSNRTYIASNSMLLNHTHAHHNTAPTFGWGSARQLCAAFHLPPSKYNPCM